MNFDDFYDESSEFRQLMHEFEESLRSSIKQEFLDRMEILERDNANLREIRDNWDRKVRELQEACIQREAEAQKVIRDAKRIRFRELISEVTPVVYAIDYNIVPKPKCNLCDEYRRIKYITPTGRQATENCTCNDSNYEYYVKPVHAVQLKYDDNGIKRVEYLFNEDAEDRLSALRSRLIDDEPFDIKNRYGAMFLSEEKAKAYAEWLNKEERNKRWV